MYVVMVYLVRLLRFFLSDLVLIERGEEDLETIKKNFPKMSWKWANEAWKHRLRIENWPTALRNAFPGPGFNLAHVTKEDDRKEGKRARTEAVKRMRDEMQAAYQNGSSEGDFTRIVSWTEGAPYAVAISTD